MWGKRIEDDDWDEGGLGIQEVFENLYQSEKFTFKCCLLAASGRKTLKFSRIYCVKHAAGNVKQPCREKI